MTLRSESVSQLERDRGLAATGQTGDHATSRGTNALTSEESIDVFPARLERGTESIGNLDIGETASLNRLSQTASGRNSLGLLGGLLHSSLLGGGLGGLHSSLLRRLHAIRITPNRAFLKIIFFFLFR